MVSLNSKVVAYVEARMRSEMGSLIERNGGVGYSAPVLQEIYLKDNPKVQQLVRDICQGDVEAMVLLTGVGTQALIETAAGMGQRDEFIYSLDHRIVIARSPKPAAVLRRHNIHIDAMPPEPYTSAELLVVIKDIGPNAWLEGKRVAVQAYGSPAGMLTQGLTELGAKVEEITLYTWGPPEDSGPVVALIDHLAEGKIDAIAFTSQPQVRNLLAIAGEANKEVSLRESLGSSSVAVASVGPITTLALEQAGIKVDVEPDHPHMGSLIQALAAYLDRSGH